MKTKILAMIFLVSMAGAVTAVNTSNFQRNHTRINCNLNNGKLIRSEFRANKLKRNKIDLKNKWQNSENKRNKKSTICQLPVKNNFKSRRK